MSNVYAVAENDNYKVTVRYDDTAESPREWDNVCDIITFSTQVHIKEGVYKDMEASQFMREVEPKMDFFISPLYMYNHSGISLSLSPITCDWDTSKIGWVYVTLDRFKEHYFDDYTGSEEQKKKLTDAINGELSVFNDYYAGNVFYFTLEKKVTCQCCDHVAYSDIDSVGGYYFNSFKECKTLVKDFVGRDLVELADKLERV